MSETNISEARLAANRENAQKSTGPVTEEGKAKACLNAVKHGLTGATVMFASAEDAKNYANHVADYRQQFQPVGREESALVQSIADIRWRLATIPVLELGILAMGSAELIDTNAEWAKPENQTKLALEVRRRHEKELRNLALQENRLARRREREMAELRALQAARKAREEETLATAAKAALLTEHRDPHSSSPYLIPGLGFDFSTDRFVSYFRRLKPAQRALLLKEALAEAAEEGQTMPAAV
jgi:hypothetical protein